MAITPFIPTEDQFVWLGGRSPYPKATRLNTSTVIVYYIFKAPASQNLNSVTVVISSTAGTLAGIGTVNLYAASSDYRKTGPALATQTFTPANGLQTITFSSPFALTLNTYYVVEILNNDGTPATNRFDITIGNYESVGSATANYNHSPVASFSTTDGSTYQAPVPCMQFQATLATYGTHGTVIWASDASAQGSGIGVYNVSGSRIARQASRFSFTNGKTIAGVAFAFAKSGNPTYRLKAEIIISGSVMATSDSMPASTVASMGGVLFATPYAVPAATTCEIAITPEGVSDGDASNFFRVYGSSTFGLGGDSGFLQGSFESTGTTVSWSDAPYIFGIYPVFHCSTSGSSSSSVKRLFGVG